MLTINFYEHHSDTIIIIAFLTPSKVVPTNVNTAHERERIVVHNLHKLNARIN